MPEFRLMTARQVAEVLSVTRTRVYELAAMGAIPAVRLGRQIRFDADALRKFVAAGGAPQRPDSRPAA